MLDMYLWIVGGIFAAFCAGALVVSIVRNISSSAKPARTFTNHNGQVVVHTHAKGPYGSAYTHRPSGSSHSSTTVLAAAADSASVSGDSGGSAHCDSSSASSSACD